MNYAFRFGSVPLMLFSGTFFPVTQLPGWLRPIAYATPLWHGVALCRALSLGTVDGRARPAIHVGYLAAMAAIGLWVGAAAASAAALCLSRRCRRSGESAERSSQRYRSASRWSASPLCPGRAGCG